jgi:hypothetical protein
MKKTMLLAALSASLLMGTAVTAPAHAATRGARFWVIDHEDPTPANIQMGNAVEKALAADPTGMSLMDVSKCLKPGDRSCASAHDLLVRILYYDPHASVHGAPLADVSQLPEFYRTEVVMETAPEGIYQMDCERTSIGSPSGFEPFGNCVQRGFYLKKGELAYVDKTTRRVIGAEDCANPVGRRVGRVPCALIHVPQWAYDRDLHIAQFGSIDISQDICTWMLRPGETEHESPFVERCAGIRCDYSGVADYLKEEFQVAGSWGAQPGMTVISVPIACATDNAKCRVVFCKGVERYDYTDVLGVQTIDFKLSKQGVWEATIQESQVVTEQMSVMDTKGHPSDLFWHYRSGFMPDSLPK